jgi:hypothetical protein
MLCPVSDVSTSTSVAVTVQLTTGWSVDVNVNKQGNGGTWVVVGTFYFSATANQTVQVTNSGTTGTMVANAFSWTYVPLGGPPTQVAENVNDTNAATVVGSLTTGVIHCQDKSYVDAQAQLPALVTPYHVVGFTYDLAAQEAAQNQVDGIAVPISDVDLTTNPPTVKALIAQNKPTFI